MRNWRKRPSPVREIHQEAEQRPALGAENFLDREAGRVRLVDGAHQVLADPRKLRSAAEIPVDDAGGGQRVGIDDVVGGRLAGAPLHLARMMIERQMAARDIGQVGGDVASRNRDPAVLHVLGMNEGDLVDQVHLFQKNAADQTIEIAAGHQAELRRGHRLLLEAESDCLYPAILNTALAPTMRVRQGLANHARPAARLRFKRAAANLTRPPRRSDNRDGAVHAPDPETD